MLVVQVMMMMMIMVIVMIVLKVIGLFFFALVDHVINT